MRSFLYSKIDKHFMKVSLTLRSNMRYCHLIHLHHLKSPDHILLLQAQNISSCNKR